MSYGLPEWSSRAIQQACQSGSWESLIEEVETGLKRSNKLNKKFSDYTENEQAVLVEQQMKLLQLSDSSSLYDFSRCLNASVDDELMTLLSTYNASSETIPSVQTLQTICSRAVIGALESSPPELASTAKLFINRNIPEGLRSFIWSSSLRILSCTPETLPPYRIPPSLDVLLARRCHQLLDSHYSELASRSAAAVTKGVVAEYLRRVNCELPQSDSDRNSWNSFDRVFFLTVPLSCIFPGAAVDSSSVKPQRTLDTALNCLTEARHLDIISRIPSRDNVKGSSLTSAVRLRSISPLLSYTQSLVAHKNKELHEHLIALSTTSHTKGSGEQMYSFYEVLINENLLRGLSGLLSLPSTLFVWDQCFICGFSMMLPAVCTALILGCANELIALVHASSLADTFVSYCRHASPETIQRLLTDHCADEMRDVFDIEGTYRLDYDEDSDGLLVAIYNHIDGALTANASVKSPARNSTGENGHPPLRAKEPAHGEFEGSDGNNADRARSDTADTFTNKTGDKIADDTNDQVGITSKDEASGRPSTTSKDKESNEYKVDTEETPNDDTGKIVADKSEDNTTEKVDETIQNKLEDETNNEDESGNESEEHSTSNNSEEIRESKSADDENANRERVSSKSVNSRHSDEESTGHVNASPRSNASNRSSTDGNK